MVPVKPFDTYGVDRCGGMRSIVPVAVIVPTLLAGAYRHYV